MAVRVERYTGRIVAGVFGLVALGLLPFVPAVTHDGQTFTWKALLPPLLAIILALVTRRLLPSLGAAVVIGAVASYGFGGGLSRTATRYAWENASDAWHLYILGFTVTLLGMVQVLNRSGGTRGIVEGVKRFIASARASRIGTAVMGLLVFFDDYANCMLVGPTMRPLTDKFRVSREKLAYLIDSTAAPVAGLVLISTWVGYEIGVLDEISKKLELGESGYSLLFAALPFRFYCIFALAFVFLTSWMGRDFGPMLRAERRALHEGKLLRDGAAPMSGGDEEDEHARPPEGAPLRAINAVVPIVVVVVGTLGGLIYDGGGLSKLVAAPSNTVSFDFWRETLGGAENSVKVLLYAAVAGAGVGLTLPLVQRILNVTEALAAFARGARSGSYAAGVLLLAWALAKLCEDLGTGNVVVGLLGDSLSPWSIPVATFCAAAVVAFATGTSWGTMAILIPTAVPLAHATGDSMILIITMASVLDGAIFGDHCSPISDTTLMSSIASGSDHLDHVQTQAPYALTAMGAALLCGYLPVALGWPSWLAYSAGIAALAAWLLAVGRRADVAPAAGATS